MSTHLQPQVPEIAPRRIVEAPWWASWWKSMSATAVALILAISTLALVSLLARPLALVFLAVVISSALAPIVDWLTRWLPRALAVILIYLVILLVLLGLMGLVIPPLVSEAQAFSERAPELFRDAERWLRDAGLLESDRPLQDTMTDVATNIGMGVVSVPLTVFSATLDVIMMFIISLYLLVETERIRGFVFSFIPPRHTARAELVVAELGNASGGYVRGVMLGVLIIGMISYAGYMLIGLQFALILALFNALAEIFPIVGPIVGAIPALLVAVLDSPSTALITLAFVIGLQQFESNVITPVVMHRQIEISPLLVIIAIFAGTAVAGIIGALVALPLTAVLRVLVVRIVAPAVRRATGAEEGPLELNESE